MPFENPPLEAIFRLIRAMRTIAVVGLSPNPDRPSHDVASALKTFGYRIIPVRPGVAAVLGEPAYADLQEIPAALRREIDVVQVFRRSEHVGAIVDSCIGLGFETLWLQDGVVDEAAAARAVAAGMNVVMDRCLLRDHVALMRRSSGLQ